MERVVNSLEAIGIGDLVTIGGDDTCHSAREVARASRGRINVVHVPKTIDNDLPLPPGVPTFGFETARAEATRILSHLMEDARTTGRWYVAVLMGRSAGHLALGAARAAGTTIALVAEEFPSGDIELADITRQLEGAAIKRLAMGRNYGVAVLAEGIGERLNIATLPNGENIPRDEHGHLRLAEVPLGALVARKMSSSLAELGVQATVVAKDLGYELRCAPPNAYDIAYSRELGAGAIITLLDGGSEVMITRQGENIVPVPLSDVLDRKTGRTKVRLLDLSSPSVRIAQSLEVRLERKDLAPGPLLDELQRVSRLDVAALHQRYFGVSEGRVSQI